jgi:hypothetical protein
MSKKTIFEKLTDAATPGAQSDSKPMTAREIAAAKAKKKTRGAAHKRATKTAAKKTAPKKKAKKSKR